MAADADKPRERTISVSASGTVVADPDLAYISTGVVSEADTAKDALARNTTAMARLIDALKALRVAAKDIQTANLNVSPRYTQPKDGRPSTINGYQVVNQVRLTVRDIKRLGELLDQAIVLGANQVHGISFDVAGAETLKDEARKQAMANAKRRAELYATAAGVSLGEVLSIAEEMRGSARPLPMGRAAMAGEVPIEAGTLTLAVEVHVTYALR